MALATASTGLLGCGDDLTRAPDAAPTPDTAPVFKGYDADEGGEVRVEYVRRFPMGTLTNRPRVTAFFYNNSGTTKFFPFVNTNGCTNSSLKTTWPTASNPVDQRTYLDPGMVTISGGTMPLTIPKMATMAADVAGRVHPANAWAFQPIVDMGGTEASMIMPEKTLLDVAISGTADMPQQTFNDVVFMPADYDLQVPDQAPVPLVANTALTLTWTTPAVTPPAGFEINSLVAFTGANGPAVICVEPNDGSMTIPAEFVNIGRAAYPTGGTLARQTVTHVVRELVDRNGPTGKRIDFLGIWCYATAFTVMP